MRISDWSSDVCSSDLMFQGWVTATGGPGAEGIAVFEPALAEHRATGEVIEVCSFLGVPAELLGSNGRAAAALAPIAEAPDLVGRTSEPACEVPLHRAQPKRADGWRVGKEWVGR